MRDEEKCERDQRHERMVSSLLKDFKCFEYGEYLMDEFQMILKKKWQRNETTVPWSKVCYWSNDEIDARFNFHPDCKLSEYFYSVTVFNHLSFSVIQAD